MTYRSLNNLTGSVLYMLTTMFALHSTQQPIALIVWVSLIIDFAAGLKRDFLSLGLNSLFPLQGIEWSTDTVFQQTLQNADELELQACILPTLQDIDTIQVCTQSDCQFHVPIVVAV